MENSNVLSLTFGNEKVTIDVKRQAGGALHKFLCDASLCYILGMVFCKKGEELPC